MKKLTIIVGTCLLLLAFVSCNKDNEDNGGNGGGDTQPTEGSLTGVFSVGNGKQVRFSQGNLQYQASTDTWRFADNQFDCIGNANSNVSLFYQGWVDLFGWGTSGYNDVKPWLIDYKMEANSITGSKYDWGLNNAISNGGNKAGLWHLLTIDEWGYIVNSRNGSRFAKATVNNVRGLLLLPDGWSTVTYALNAINDAQGGYESNYISMADWSNVLEANATNCFLIRGNSTEVQFFCTTKGKISSTDGLQRTRNPTLQCCTFSIGQYYFRRRQIVIPRHIA